MAPSTSYTPRVKSPKQVFNLREKCYKVLMTHFPEAPGWQTKAVNDLLRTADIDCSPELLQDLIQSPLHETVYSICSRFVGNLDRLNKGQRLKMWDGKLESMLLYCTDIFPLKKSGRTYLYKVLVDVLKGSAAGQFSEMIMPSWLCSRTAAEVSGKKRSQPFAYDLGGMAFTALVRSSPRAEMEIEELDVQPCELSFNRQIRRDRAKGCVKNRAQDCDYCKYGRQSCSLAYHRKTFFRGVCTHPRCLTEGWLTPYGICTECVTLGRLPPGKQKG